VLNDVPSEPAGVLGSRPDRRLDAIRRYLPAALALLCALQLAAWVPHYVTWPWSTDHDVFATAAHSWDAGIVPYRDFRLNNFPGTLYLFWVLGRLFGWTATAPLYVLDAVLLAVFGAVLWIWSRKQFGDALAGSVTYALFLSYYLGLNYSLVAQRDWHASLLAVSAVIVVQNWHTRPAWITAGVLFALGCSIRPQAVLFLPAAAAALEVHVRRASDRRTAWLAPAVTLSLAFAAMLVLLAYPLVRAGAFSDFVASITALARSRSYGDMSVGAIVKRAAFAVVPVKMLLVPAVAALLWNGSDRAVRRAVLPWLLAYAGALAYDALGPRDNPYLFHPLMLTWSMLAGALAAMVSRPRDSRALSLALVLLIVASGVTLKPAFADLGRAARAFRLGRDDGARPPVGYTAGGVVPTSRAFSARYEWRDYSATVRYLERLPRTTRVANALYGAPALTGPSGRLSVLPAESIAWLIIVDRGDEPTFADALQRATDAVVVWSPSEVRARAHPALTRVFSVIQTDYEPDRQFGEIEVWRRRK
jgi:hypothetical protein